MAVRKMPFVGRGRDEVLLAWVQARTMGQTSAAIAARSGLTGEAVGAVTKAVRDADIDHATGVDQAIARASYWAAK